MSDNKIDYRALLTKYMHYVVEMEGASFVENVHSGNADTKHCKITEEEIEELKKIDKEVTLTFQQLNGGGDPLGMNAYMHQIVDEFNEKGSQEDKPRFTIIEGGNNDVTF